MPACPRCAATWRESPRCFRGADRSGRRFARQHVARGGATLIDQPVGIGMDEDFYARKLGQQLMCSSAERFNVERYASEVLTVYHAVLSRPTR